MTDRIRATAASGVAVLLISTELEELIALSHRIAVIHRGRIVGEMARQELDLQRLGLLMGGRAS
jgi:simple sugar transport system ATP-binding protein